MWKFFKRYPSANDVSLSDISDIEKMIKPIGLSRKRSVALVKMSNDYINIDWRDRPDKLYGIGKYGSDAYRIFCLGDWKNVSPKDHALNDYHSWLKTYFQR
tara:strand:- start:94 stop:396 length:303 start_codon:yes stop_codon:yes gene_type:complete